MSGYLKPWVLTDVCRIFRFWDNMQPLPQVETAFLQWYNAIVPTLLEESEFLSLWSSWRWCQMFRSGGGRPCPSGMLSRIPSLYPLDARNNPECLQALQRHRQRRGQKSSQLNLWRWLNTVSSLISSVGFIFSSLQMGGPKYTRPPLHPKYPMVSRMVKFWDFRWMIMGPTQNFRSKIKLFLECFIFWAKVLLKAVSYS